MTEEQTQAGLKEHLLSLIPEDQRQYLQPYYPGGVEKAREGIFYLQGAVERTLTLNYTLYHGKWKMRVPTHEQEIGTLINSGKLVLESKPREAVSEPLVSATAIRTNISPHDHRKDFECGEGLFNLDLSWSDERIGDGKETRLFEIGFYVNDKGDLIIAKCQRNRLGHFFRGTTYGLDSSKDLPEKKLGDNYLRQIHEETGLTAEAFGLLASIMVLGDKVPSGDLLVPLFEAQPQIAQRLDQMNHYCQMGIAYEEQAYELEKEIKRLRLMTDFQAMLEQIGVRKDVLKEEPPFLRVPIKVIKMAMHKRFTDDAKYPNRYLYRGILYGLVQAR